MKRPLSIFKLILTLSIAFLVSSNVNGQIEKKETPLSTILNVLPSTKQVLDLTPNFDWNKIAEEDNVNHKQGNPLRAGLSVPANVNINNSGEWVKLSNGSMMWRLTLKSEGATSLGLVFDEFELPAGSKLFVYDPSKKDVIGALGSHNNNPSQVLSTRLVLGNSLTIEYIEPTQNVPSDAKAEVTNYRTSAKLNLGELIYVYTDAFQSLDNSKPSPGASASCQIDINCSPVGDDWQDEKRGVAHIVFRVGPTNWYVCTGSLVNNTNQDATPYFLTANHCGGDASAADRNVWQFYFNYERPTCGSGTAPQNQTITGCELKSTGPISGGSDFQLLLLSNNVPENYAPYYNGWSRLATNPASGASIHHPSGDVKKISTSNSINNNSSTVNISGSIMPANSTWRVTWGSNANGWGVTEGGSSGSPLFNQSGLIIGTLSGGSSSCTAQSAPDYYGKFSYHWESNGSAASIKLSPWLDPAASGVNTLDGYDPYAIPVGETILAENFEGTTFPPTGWSLQTAVAANTWQVTTGYSITGTPPTPIVPQDGLKFAYVQWQNAQNQNEWLISPVIDLTDKTELALSFYFNGSYHWSVTNNNCDLTLKARINNGTWTNLWTEADYTWSTELNYVWNKVTISDLTAYEGQANVQFAFVYTGNDGANFNVDNISLFSSTPSGDPTLLKPRNLSASLVNENDIELTWSVPGAIGDPTLVYYANIADVTNLNWPTPERATLFNLTDFGLSYPAEISRLVHVLVEHPDHQWPNSNFQFKVYAFGNSTPLYTSGLIQATHLQEISHVLETPIMVTDNFYVSIVPVDASGHPSSGSKKVPTGTGHSYRMNTGGGWLIYDDGTDAYEFIISVEVAGAAKISYNGNDYKHNLTSTIDLTKVAEVEKDQLPSLRAEGTLSGYKVFRNSAAIATIDNPATTSYIDENMSLGYYTYYVTALYSDPEGESLPSNTVQITLTSIDSDILSNVSMYPNPFQNSITINNAEQLNKVVVTNLIGQTLINIPLHGSSTEYIPTSRLAKGVYLITVYGKNGERKVSKMIKE